MNKRGMIDAREESVSVYVLCDPRTNEVRYVGETIDTMNRMRGHRSCTANKERTEWVKELEGLGLQPVMKVVSIVQRSECYEEERRVIELHRSQGCLLFNKKRAGKVVKKKVLKGWGSYRILWKQTGHVFNSAAEAGRYFGMNEGTIRNNAKRQAKIDGMSVISMPLVGIVEMVKEAVI